MPVQTGFFMNSIGNGAVALSLSIGNGGNGKSSSGRSTNDRYFLFDIQYPTPNEAAANITSSIISFMLCLLIFVFML